MPNSIEIKQFKLSEKRELLFFLKCAYTDNPRQADEKFWDWHFLESPFAEPDNMPVWVAKDGAKIVGQLAAIPVKLKVGETQKSAIWILDFIVDENYRGKGIGKNLVGASEEFCPLGLGVNTSEQHAPALLQKLGWKIVGKISRYNKLLFPGEALREVSQIKPLRSILNAAFFPFRPKDKFDFSNPNSNVRLVENIDFSFDELWLESKMNWSCGVARTSKILNWQYRRQPGKKFDILGYFQNEKLLGYAVLFFRKKNKYGAISKASLTDIFYHSENSVEIVDELLRGAIRFAAQRRAGTLVTDVIDSLIQKRLTKFGFRRTKNPLQLMVKSPDNQELLYNPENWFLTRGDSDTSIFEHPNL
ncbi:MAG: GNAT family N-acetyltransferase [Pyrinomonadaceae bacterium]